MYAYEAAFMLSLGCLCCGIFFYAAGKQNKPSLNLLAIVLMTGMLGFAGHAFIKGTKMELARDACVATIQQNANWAAQPLADLRAAAEAATPNFGIAPQHHTAVQGACYDRLKYQSEHTQ